MLPPADQGPGHPGRPSSVDVDGHLGEVSPAGPRGVAPALGATDR